MRANERNPAPDTAHTDHTAREAAASLRVAARQRNAPATTAGGEAVLLRQEIDELLQSGHLIPDAARNAVAPTAAPAPPPLYQHLFEQLAAAPRHPDWPYHEPVDVQAIDAGLPPCGPADHLPPEPLLVERTLSGWLGRAAAGHDPPAAGQTPLEVSAGGDGTLLALLLVLTHGPAFDLADAAHAWRQVAPFLRLDTDDAAAYRNLAAGVAPPDSALRRNPWREWDGALARGDLFGYLAPGDPRHAARLARKDASVSHTANGLYAAMWAAALTSAAFTARDAQEAVAVSLRHVPPASRLGEALRDVLVAHARGLTWAQAVGGIRAPSSEAEPVDGYPPRHALVAACAVAAALLWADGHYQPAVDYARQVPGGPLPWDRKPAADQRPCGEEAVPPTASADVGCTATARTLVGSVAGVLGGLPTLPAPARALARTPVHSRLPDGGPGTVTELAARIRQLARQMG